MHQDGLDLRIDPQLDHAAKPIAIASEQIRQRLAVAAAELLDRVGCVAGCVLHDSPHTPYPRGAESRTEEMKNSAYEAVRALFVE